MVGGDGRPTGECRRGEHKILEDKTEVWFELFILSP